MSLKAALHSLSCLVIFCLCAGQTRLGAGELGAPAGPQPYKAYACIFHVHSRISSPDCYSLPELTRVARRYGVDAIFLSDNLSYTIEYGLPPLRHILWLNYSRPSVMTLGPQAYLDMVAAENRRQSDVLYVPGVEVCPRFYWTGTRKEKNLVCHDHQRNLIAVGTIDAGVIARIPEARGYVWRKNPVWICLTRLVPILLLALCLFCWKAVAFLSANSGYSRRALLRSYVLGIILPLLLLLIAIHVVAALVPAFDIYGEDKTAHHEQRTIAFLSKSEVVHYWAHPEARDDSNFRYLGVGFNVHTKPYPEMLLRTSGYTGFGGVYEDQNTLTEPQSYWDTVLQEYIEGRRKVPAWCFGEMLYHYEGQAGKRLGNVETMVWARQKTMPALLQSLREGRFYARNNTEKQSLTLEEWKVWPNASNRVDVSLHVTSRTEGEKVNMRLIRNGRVVKELNTMTPLRLEFQDVPPPGVGMSYYRVVILGAYPLKLVTNPLFVPGQARTPPTNGPSD